jgi:hypothetical protein
MDTVSLDQLFQQIGTAAIFVISAYLIWRRNVNISDRYFTFLEERVKTFEQQLLTASAIVDREVALTARPFQDTSKPTS